MDLDKFKRNGYFLMLALDHRGSFKKLMSPKDPNSISDQQVIYLKHEIIKNLDSQFSGILIDAPTGLPAYGNKIAPFLLPMEKTGFIDEFGQKINQIEFSVSQLIELGANGAKILIYFNPKLSSESRQLETSKKALEDAKLHNFPLFLEIVTYEINPIEEQREKLVLSSVEKFLEAGIIPDVFKLEYPGNLEACQKISNMLGQTPWVLLTRGDNFEHFRLKLQDAIAGGAKGFLAGRALWQEACKLEGEDKQKFLSETLPERFKIISEITLSS